MRLNLGSGTNRKQGYISVDKYVPEADAWWDLTEELPVDNESVDNIFASHVVEHFSRKEWEFISKDWARVMKPGGVIEIHCPDIMRSIEGVLSGAYDLNIIYGNQNTPGEFHKNGFTYKTICDSFPGFYGELLEPSTDYELHLKLTKEIAWDLAWFSKPQLMLTVLAKQLSRSSETTMNTSMKLSTKNAYR